MTWQLQVDAFLLLDADNGAEKQVCSRKSTESLLSFTRQPDAKAALETLCHGLEANSLWSEFDEVRLVARADPAPMLAAFGRFSPRQRMLLGNLSAELTDVIQNHRYVNYAEAEKAAERLAAKLLARYGRDALAEFRFTAIPRGGWIVLGMLSYCLGLRHEQIGLPGDLFDDGERRTWVVVDDCALSGVRFRQFLRSRGLDSVIFCPLFAPPGLCEAIARAEPGVEACLNAVDLRDVAPERFGQSYPQWLERRRARIGEAGAWLGITEYVAFAWCEPQS
ncbi:phosphoribosyltransferase [Halomonas sp. E14]|uniref:phosphoribosyltransferase n=1 Tax=Halomonas sp. E14 TaxID=3397245 RepID=UPI00403E97FA